MGRRGEIIFVVIFLVLFVCSVYLNFYDSVVFKSPNIDFGEGDSPILYCTYCDSEMTKTRDVALMIIADYDFNGAFYTYLLAGAEPFMEGGISVYQAGEWMRDYNWKDYHFKWLNPEQFDDYSELDDIFYEVVVRDHVSSKDEFEYVIRETYEKYGKIDFLYVGAHGEGDRIALSAKNSFFVPQYNYLSVEDIEKGYLDGFDKYFDEGSGMCLLSCSTNNPEIDKNFAQSLMGALGIDHGLSPTVPVGGYLGKIKLDGKSCVVIAPTEVHDTPPVSCWEDPGRENLKDPNFIKQLLFHGEYRKLEGGDLNSISKYPRARHIIYHEGALPSEEFADSFENVDWSNYPELEEVEVEYYHSVRDFWYGDWMFEQNLEYWETRERGEDYISKIIDDSSQRVIGFEAYPSGRYSYGDLRRDSCLEWTNKHYLSYKDAKGLDGSPYPNIWFYVDSHHEVDSAYQHVICQD